LVTSAYRESFFSPKKYADHQVAIASARAGNVIGGGDWATDRIIPDLVTAYSNGQLPILRYPDAIRPWQHVLDCLHGYLKLIDYMLVTKSGGEWNFGPNNNIKHTVGELTKAVAVEFGITNQAWKLESSKQLGEAGYLLLDSSKARTILNWKDRLAFKTAVEWTINWYKKGEIESINDVTRGQISEYFDLS
jgi:CDP-glucose 4,6-dehydratase